MVLLHCIKTGLTSILLKVPKTAPAATPRCAIFVALNASLVHHFTGTFSRAERVHEYIITNITNQGLSFGIGVPKTKVMNVVIV